MNMRTLLLAAAASAALTGAAWAGDLAPGMTPGTERDAIAAALAKEGYSVTRIKREHDRIEAKAEREGRRYEVKIDGRSGNILYVEDKADGFARSTGAAADAGLKPGTTLGTERDAIVAALAKEGYSVIRIKREHGRIEAKAERDGRRYEIKIDGWSGQVLRVKEDD